MHSSSDRYILNLSYRSLHYLDYEFFFHFHVEGVKGISIISSIIGYQTKLVSLFLLNKFFCAFILPLSL